MLFETFKVSKEGAVLFVVIAAPRSIFLRRSSKDQRTTAPSGCSSTARRNVISAVIWNGSSTPRATLTRPNEGLEATSSEMILQLRKR